MERDLDPDVNNPFNIPNSHRPMLEAVDLRPDYGPSSLQMADHNSNQSLEGPRRNHIMQ